MSLPGWKYALRRWWIERQILRTGAVHTAPAGAGAEQCELHIMTYDHDWRMALWTAKSFYHVSGTNWPMVFHEGGRLAPRFQEQMLRHFPSASVLTMKVANERVNPILEQRGLARCMEARRRSIMLVKLIDCLALSQARHLLILDSDVLFFSRPDEILAGVSSGARASVFNRDCAMFEHYTITPEAAKARFGLDLAPSVNAGIALVHRQSLPLEMLEEFLTDPDVGSDPWLTEQTLQALCGSRIGLRLLSDLYAVSRQPGLTNNAGVPLVAKHYPTYPRPLLYFEGMRHLLSTDMFRQRAARNSGAERKSPPLRGEG